MPAHKVGLTVAAVAAAGVIVAGGSAIANAASTPTPTTSQDQQGAQSGGWAQGRPGGPHGTVVTGTEAAKITAAVRAKDSAVSVTRIWKDADGSVDVLGTKGGQSVLFEVSADLRTVTQGVIRGVGHDGRHGGAEASAADAARVAAAVKAKDPAFTVQSVTKESDGSFDAFGSRRGQRAMYEVSVDLKTLTLDTRGPAGGHDGGRQAQPGSTSATAPTA